MQTKDGVCYDLHESPFTADVDGYTFHFSSRPHREKFLDRLDAETAAVNGSLTRRFGFEVHARPWAALRLYRKIETRGFLVADSLDLEGGELDCPDCLRFDGCARRRNG